MAADPLRGAYVILYCLERSSRDSIGVSNRDTVRNAAKLAVYEAIIMKPKSHQVAATKRPDKFFGASPPPCKYKKSIHFYKSNLQF